MAFLMLYKAVGYPLSSNMSSEAIKALRNRTLRNQTLRNQTLRNPTKKPDFKKPDFKKPNFWEIIDNVID